MRSPRPAAGFTLVEILVVIAILVTLMALLMPALRTVRVAGKKAACASSLRQIGLSYQAYALDNTGRLPYIAFLPGGGAMALRWSDYLTEYAEAAKSANGMINLASGRSVLAGCPEFKASLVWVIGYGMNGYLKRTYADGLYGGTYWISNQLSLITPPGPIRHFFWGRLSYPATRMLVADTTDYHTGAIDYARHGRSYNTLFCDGHVGSLAGADQSLRALDQPDR